MAETALVTGVAGQDGSLLCDVLVRAGLEVHGITRRATESVVLSHVALHRVDLSEPTRAAALVAELQPDFVFYLAAHHASSEHYQQEALEQFLRVNTWTPAAMLEVLEHRRRGRFFYASSCHVFGLPRSAPQNEQTPRQPANHYALSKHLAEEICRYFRRQRQVFAAVGILFNHESPLRGTSYVTGKLARAAALVALGRGAPLRVRRLDAEVDWGAAEEYMDAVWRIAQLDEADDFIIASGVVHSVRDFAAAAFGYVGADYREWVTDEAAAGAAQTHVYHGDPAKLRAATGWQARADVRQIACRMVEWHLAAERAVTQ